MTRAKYLFEFEKIFFNFMYIFIYIVSFCNISVVAQIGIGIYQYYQYSYPNIEANIFEARFLKSCQAGKLISSHLVLLISKNFSSMTPNHSGCPSLPL